MVVSLFAALPYKGDLVLEYWGHVDDRMLMFDSVCKKFVLCRNNAVLCK